jgi:mono/diheme cytochrome c family protein
MGSRILLPAAVVAALAASAVAAGGGRADVPGNPKVGKALFLRAGLFCGSCHTLKAAGSHGRDGPNLDQAKPSYARIVDFVTNGRPPTKRWPTGSPGFGGKHRELTRGEIQDVAAFVYLATHR